MRPHSLHKLKMQQQYIAYTYQHYLHLTSKQPLLTQELHQDVDILMTHSCHRMCITQNFPHTTWTTSSSNQTERAPVQPLKNSNNHSHHPHTKILPFLTQFKQICRCQLHQYAHTIRSSHLW